MRAGLEAGRGVAWGRTSTVRGMVWTRGSSCRCCATTAVGQAKIRVIERALSEQEFNELLLGLDVVALPNQPAASATNASGIFTLALGLGVIPVSHAASWMARQSEARGVGVVYTSYDAKGLRAALDEAVSHRQTLRSAILRQAEDWQRQHSADQLLDRILLLGR